VFSLQRFYSASVEAFDGEGELMAMFFGARKPGVPERAEWRQIVAKLSRLATSEAPAR